MEVRFLFGVPLSGPVFWREERGVTGWDSTFRLTTEEFNRASAGLNDLIAGKVIDSGQVHQVAGETLISTKTYESDLVYNLLRQVLGEPNK